MKKPLDSSGSAMGWLGPSLVVSGLLTGPAAGQHLEDPAHCPEASSGREEGESWGVMMLPVSPNEAMAYDELLLAAQGVTPAAQEGGVGLTAGMSPESSRPGQGLVASVEALASLRAEVAELRETRTSTQRELRDMRERLQELERKFDDLLAMQDFDAEEVPVDPHKRWIERNLDELRKYPDMFVALDPDRGILVHASEQREFAAKLDALTPEENERVMLFHTSMYLRG